MADGALRIDKWLWFARVVKTRAAASRLCEDGAVRINGARITQAHKPVRIGDAVTCMVHDRVKVLKVLALAERRGPFSEAQLIYEDLSPDTPRPDLPSPIETRGDAGARPTKADRRAINRLKNGQS